MSEMRLMEKLRGNKFTDYAYVWNTTYNTMLSRSSDGDFPANLRTTATQAFTVASADPTWDSTEFNFILPRRYQYTTVFDGVARGNIKLKLYDDNTPNCTHHSYFMRMKIVLKSITDAGVATTLASSAYSTSIENKVYGGAGASTLTVDIPFWLDLDNIILPNDQRLVVNVVVNGGMFVHTGHVSGTHSCVGTFYHTVNTDEFFIELPIVP